MTTPPTFTAEHAAQLAALLELCAYWAERDETDGAADRLVMIRHHATAGMPRHATAGQPKWRNLEADDTKQPPPPESGEDGLEARAASFGFFTGQRWDHAAAVFARTVRDEATAALRAEGKINADAIDDLRKIVSAFTGNSHENTHALDLTTLLGHHIEKLRAQVEALQRELEQARERIDKAKAIL